MDPESCCETQLPSEGQVWGLAGISSSGRGHRARALLGALVEALLLATPAVTSVPSSELLSLAGRLCQVHCFSVLACTLGNPPDPWVLVRFFLSVFKKLYLLIFGCAGSSLLLGLFSSGKQGPLPGRGA